MLQTTIRFRGGPADGLARQLPGYIPVGFEVRVPPGTTPGDDPVLRSAVYLVTAAPPAPLFGLCPDEGLSARADYFCQDVCRDEAG